MSLSLGSVQTASPTGLLAANAAEDLRTYLMRLSHGTDAAGLARANNAHSGCVPCGLVDIRNAAPSVRLLPAPSWSSPELRFLVRPEVAERLEQAASVLPSDIRLGFWEGLRPLAIQQSLWETSLTYLRTTYPTLQGAELEATLELFVARPVGRPPHSTGSAVDVAPVDAFGKVLTPNTSWGKLGTEILARALKNTGLAHYEPEWWHWSYGDEEWARTYDCSPLDFSVEPEFDGPGGGI